MGHADIHIMTHKSMSQAWPKSNHLSAKVDKKKNRKKLQPKL